MRISDWSSDVCSSDLVTREEYRKVEVRLLVGQLPDNQRDQRHGGHDRRPNDEGRREPVEFAALVDHHLEGAHEDREKQQPDHTDPLALDRRLAVAQLPPYDAGDRRTEQDVDVEDPAPVIVVRDIAAEDWTEDGRHHSSHSQDCEADIRSLLWKDRDQQYPGERDQRAARQTLTNSEGHEQSGAVRQPA